MTISNPVALAIFFQVLTETVFSVLLGVDPEENSKQTPPLRSRRKGLFGTSVAAFGVVEEQARGTPHCHTLVWAGLSPSVLQSFACAEKLMTKVTEIIDRMISAQLDSKIIAKFLLDNFERKTPKISTLQKICDPILEPETFASDAHSVAALTNMHSHSFTCHKGKYGKEMCRMSRPVAFCEKTNSVQLLPKRDDSTGKVVYEVLEKPSPPHIDCLPGRDFSRVPVARRDSSLHYLEVKRPELNVRLEDNSINDYRLKEVSLLIYKCTF